MGDGNRNIVFAEFIKRNFPLAKSVLVVADGNGKLSEILMSMGYNVETVEIKMRDKRAKNVKFTRKLFCRNDKITHDLIVAMHPDEATSEVVVAAKRNGIPFAVVPCCVVGYESKNVKGFDGWIKKLVQLSGGMCNMTILPISGQNLVLYKHKY